MFFGVTGTTSRPNTHVIKCLIFFCHCTLSHSSWTACTSWSMFCRLARLAEIILNEIIYSNYSYFIFVCILACLTHITCIQIRRSSHCTPILNPSENNILFHFSMFQFWCWSSNYHLLYSSHLYLRTYWISSSDYAEVFLVPVPSICYWHNPLYNAYYFSNVLLIFPFSRLITPHRENCHVWTQQSVYFH